MSGGPTPERADLRVAAVVLAAGRSSRMGGANKLLAELDGKPMVRRVTETVIRAGLDPVVVVLGHDADAVGQVLEGLPLRFTVNPRYATGIGSSVGAGIEAIDGEVDGAMVVLGDMPWITAADLRTVVEAFAPEDGRGICVPVVSGRRGNPVLWGARHFARLRGLEGDVGGRHLLEEHARDVYGVSVGGDGVLRDIDTPEALESAHAQEE